MTTTTSYGAWVNHGDDSNRTVEATVADYIGGGDADWRQRVESSGAFERMVDDYRAAINNALPDGVSLCGNEFYGPYHDDDCTWDGELNISEIIDGIDLAAIVDRNDPDAQRDTMTAFRVQLPAEVIDALTESGSPLACAGLRTHVRADADWTTLTTAAVAVLRDLDPDSDGHVDDAGMWVGGCAYPLEPVA